MQKFDLRKWPGFPLNRKEPALIDQITIDSRRIVSSEALFVALSGVHDDGHSFVRAAFRQGAKYAIVKREFASHDLPEERLIRVQDPLRAFQQIAALYRKERKAKVIAIIGSCGKTMLKDLLFQLIADCIPSCCSPGSFNSQIGVALSLLKIHDHHQIALIEAGISQAGEMEHLAEMMQADHVILTNIGKHRLGSLGSKQLLQKEMMQLFSAVPESNWCLLPSQTAPSHAKHICWDTFDARLPHIERRQQRFSITFPNHCKTVGTIHEGLPYVFDLITIAVKAAYLLQITPEHIIHKLLEYVPEPMRIEVWKSYNGTTFINDCYAADPMACDVALRQLESLEDFPSRSSRKKIFLFGGLRNEAENSDNDAARIAQSIAKHKIDLLVLSEPELASSIVSHLSTLSSNTEVIVCKDTKQAIEATKRNIASSDVVLIKGAHKIPQTELLSAFEDSPPNNQVIINLAVIQSNIEEIREKIGKDVRLMVMVKALAYGTDDVRIAKFLKSCGIDILGVSYVDEGVLIRQAGVTQSIFVLNAAEYEAAKAVKWDLEVAVSELSILDSLQMHAKAQNKTVKVHLHVNTGMNRFGCRPQDVLKMAQKICSLPNLILEGIMTHFASADDPEQDPFTIQQAAILQTAIDTLENAGFFPRWKHACNSSATIRFGFSGFNMVRIGLAAYGLHASQASKQSLPLRPAISLISRIVGINECQQGDTISYGRTYTVNQATARIAVLPIGYFDGLHRNYSDKGYCMIRGKKAPMCGKICMDYMMVDISDIPDAAIGDQALLFGEDDSGSYLPPEELATLGGSIVHELMTCLGPRIRRCFIYDESLRSR